MRFIYRLFLLFFGALLVISSCRKSNVKKKVKIDRNKFTTEEQAVIGSTIRDAIAANSGIFPVLRESQYPMAYSYLQDSIFNVAVNTSVVTKRNDFDWEVIILDDDTERNAFILPGGYFYIYTGMLKFLNSNAELMGLVAHEIAYAESGLVTDNLVERFDGVVIHDLTNNRLIPQLNDIAEYFTRIQYDKPEVLFADSFAMELICPFNYESLGLLQVIDRADKSPERVSWDISKNCDFIDRKNLIERIRFNDMDCAAGSNITLSDAYSRLKNSYLP